MLAGDTAQLRKARGAFFTPAELCRYVAEWAIRTPDDAVLEPSCGEAAFLLASGSRLAELTAGASVLVGSGSLSGVELHTASAAEARGLLHARGLDADIRVGNFLAEEPRPIYDAVVGNPPYVRYQAFTGSERVHGREAALRAGVALTNLASSWAAFTVHSSLFLKPGGRLGLVLPAELLTVNYASQVRSFLMRHFGRVRLVLFEERVFPGVLEEVVLLLADGVGPTDHCELRQVRDIAELWTSADVPSRWRPLVTADKWTPALVSPAARDAWAGLEAAGSFAPLQTWGETTLGMVTGNNRFFALSQRRAKELGLRSADVIRISPPGSRHLRGLTFTEKAWKELAGEDSSCLLFRPSGEPSAAAARYIVSGEKTAVDEAYKCRVRSPWWRVPLVKPADLLLTYMNADTPRLCTNRATVRHLNSVHGLYLASDHRALGMDLLPMASINSMTMLGAEITGRAYGGGMLKLEPKEADRLPVPSLALVQRCAAELRALRPQLAGALRRGNLLEAAATVDKVLLVEGCGLSRATVRAIADAHAAMSARRTSRSSGARDGG